MHTNKISLVAALAYTFLLYHEGIGLNILLLNILLIGILFWFNPKQMKEKINLGFSLAALFSACFALLHGHFLSAFANVISLLLLSVSLTLPNLSIAGYLVQGAYAFFTTPLLKISKYFSKENKEETLEESNENYSSSSANYKLITALSTLVFIIFFGIYRNMSVGFDTFIKSLNFDFISILVMFHYLIGFVLLSTFFKPFILKHLAEKESSLSSLLSYSDYKSYNIFGISVNETTEQLLAKVVFVGLNLLLLMVNVIDTFYLSQHIMPEGISFSEYVHQGVDALIWSILFAISIILWVFRGSQSFNKNKTNKILSYVWIGLNVWLVFTAAYRNHIYIQEEHLYTYKRIGVYFFLCCASIGLGLTYIKIKYKLSNYFLVQTNTLVWFVFLVLSTSINWDRIIANHHVAYSINTNKAADIDYLYKLSYAAYPAIASYSDYTIKKAYSEVIPPNQLADYPFESRMLYDTMLHHINSRTWKSYNLSNQKTLNELHEIANSK
jgi:hypothetical protein